MIDDLNDLPERAEFYLCLSLAFRIPLDPEHTTAMREALCDDLEALSASLGYAATAEIDACRQALHALNDADALLQRYSGLFLVPPYRAHLNTATYLDGTHHGGSVRELEDLYARYGLARSEQFHDLADHLSVQLEFAAHLYTVDPQSSAETSPELFLARYPARWIGPLITDLERVTGEWGMQNDPYLALARLLAKVIAHDAATPATAFAPADRRQRALAKARHQRTIQGVTESDLDEIRQRLQAHGLSIAHLAPEGQGREDPWQGWRAMRPPGPAQR